MSAENAEAIRDRTDSALKNLILAERQLASALALAENDYDHNADALRNILGGLKLISAATSMEWSTWSGYADARRRHADRKLP